MTVWISVKNNDENEAVRVSMIDGSKVTGVVDVGPLQEHDFWIHKHCELRVEEFTENKEPTT